MNCAGPGKRAKDREQTHPTRQRSLQQQRMVGATHRVLAAIEGRVSEQGGEQAESQRARKLTEGHAGLFLRGDKGRP